ncbi:hypothetical protein BGZ95_004613, partial [Linnemannia exigua]
STSAPIFQHQHSSDPKTSPASQHTSRASTISNMFKSSTLYRTVAMMLLASIVLNYVQALSWEANGGCSASWGGRCNAQCIGEATKKSICKGKEIFSSIESSGCWLGWNICKCQC